jgi:hypothetical protein
VVVVVVAVVVVSFRSLIYVGSSTTIADDLLDVVMNYDEIKQNTSTRGRLTLYQN